MKKQELLNKFYNYGIVCTDPAYNFRIDDANFQVGQLCVYLDTHAKAKKWRIISTPMPNDDNSDVFSVLSRFDTREEAYDAFYQRAWERIKEYAQPCFTKKILKTNRQQMMDYFIKESGALESDAFNIWRNLRRNADIVNEAKYLVATGNFIEPKYAYRIGEFSAQDIFEKTDLVHSKTDALMYLSLMDYQNQCSPTDKQNLALEKLKRYLKQDEKENKQKLLKNLLRTLIDPKKVTEFSVSDDDQKRIKCEINYLANELVENYDLGEEFILPKKYAELYPVKIAGFTAFQLEKLFGYKKQYAYQIMLSLRKYPKETLQNLNKRLNKAVRDILNEYGYEDQDQIERLANRLIQHPEFAKEFCLSSQIIFPEADYHRYAPIIFDPDKVKNSKLHFERYTAYSIRERVSEDFTQLQAYDMLINLFENPEQQQEAFNMKVYCKLYRFMTQDCRLTNEEASLNADQFIKQYDLGRELYIFLTQNILPDYDKQITVNNMRINDLLANPFSDNDLLAAYNWLLLFDAEPETAEEDYRKWNDFGAKTRR